MTDVQAMDAGLKESLLTTAERRLILERDQRRKERERIQEPRRRNGDVLQAYGLQTHLELPLEDLHKLYSANRET